MPPRVLYYCPCEQLDPSSSRQAAGGGPSAALASVGSGVGGPSSSQPGIPPIHPPSLPSYSASARYSFHPLESLYFCDECDQIRCNRCVTIDISSYFCPNCLFEVPGASVKAEKNRCSRNCFLCPSCTHTLQIMATDPDNDADPISTAASVGEPPYYLGCSFCRWDSKSIGLTFDKPTGLSLQLQKQEDSTPDVFEFEHLKDHFEPFIKVQTHAAAAAAAIGSRKSGSTHKSSSGAAVASQPSSTKTSATNQATAAASAALKNSKLIRDVPSLANSRYLSGIVDPKSVGRVEREEIKHYEALTSWESGRSHQDPIGVMGRREQFRRDYMAKIKGSDEKMANLDQRWTSPWDQPIRSSDLRPTRVPLKSKQSKRCPACRHIIIKPDIKAASNRFKIKLTALNYLPEIQIDLAATQPYLTFDSTTMPTSSRLHRRTSTLGLGSTASSLRRRPQSSILLGSGTSSGSGVGGMGGSSVAMATSLSSAGSSSIVLGSDVDVENLIPGKTYTFEATFINPLDDPIRVKIASIRTISEDSSSTIDPVSTTTDPFSPTLETTSPSTMTLTSSSSNSVATWQVTPSTTSFSINAYNEIWDLEEQEEQEDEKTVDDMDIDIDDDISTENQTEKPNKKFNKKPKPLILKQKGHTTTILFTVFLSHQIQPKTVLQVAVLINYHSLVVQDKDSSCLTKENPFWFWSCLDFGSVSSDSNSLLQLGKRKSFF